MNSFLCSNKKHIFLAYLAVFALFTALYLISFHSPLFASQKVLFYRGIYLLAAVFLVSLLAVLFIYFKITMSHFESLAAALVASAAINLSIFVVFPVTFDRSLTMYLLNTLDNVPIAESCSGSSKLDLRRKLINEYVIERDAVGRRIDEQKIIRTLEGQEACFRLTDRGLKFLAFSRAVGKLYGLK